MHIEVTNHVQNSKVFNCSMVCRRIKSSILSRIVYFYAYIIICTVLHNTVVLVIAGPGMQLRDKVIICY